MLKPIMYTYSLYFSMFQWLFDRTILLAMLMQPLNPANNDFSKIVKNARLICERDVMTEKALYQSDDIFSNISALSYHATLGFSESDITKYYVSNHYFGTMSLELFDT